MSSRRYINKGNDNRETEQESGEEDAKYTLGSGNLSSSSSNTNNTASEAEFLTQEIQHQQELYIQKSMETTLCWKAHFEKTNRSLQQKEKLLELSQQENKSLKTENEELKSVVREWEKKILSLQQQLVVCEERELEYRRKRNMEEDDEEVGKSSSFQQQVFYFENDDRKKRSMSRDHHHQIRVGRSGNNIFASSQNDDDDDDDTDEVSRHISHFIEKNEAEKKEKNKSTNIIDAQLSERAHQLSLLEHEFSLEKRRFQKDVEKFEKEKSAFQEIKSTQWDEVHKEIQKLISDRAFLEGEAKDKQKQLRELEHQVSRVTQQAKLQTIMDHEEWMGRRQIYQQDLDSKEQLLQERLLSVQEVERRVQTQIRNSKDLVDQHLEWIGSEKDKLDSQVQKFVMERAQFEEKKKQNDDFFHQKEKLMEEQLVSHNRQLFSQQHAAVARLQELQKRIHQERKWMGGEGEKRNINREEENNSSSYYYSTPPPKGLRREEVVDEGGRKREGGNAVDVATSTQKTPPPPRVQYPDAQGGASISPRGLSSTTTIRSPILLMKEHHDTSSRSSAMMISTVSSPSQKKFIFDHEEKEQPYPHRKKKHRKDTAISEVAYVGHQKQPYSSKPPLSSASVQSLQFSSANVSSVTADGSSRPPSSVSFVDASISSLSHTAGINEATQSTHPKEYGHQEVLQGQPAQQRSLSSASSQSGLSLPAAFFHDHELGQEVRHRIAQHEFTSTGGQREGGGGALKKEFASELGHNKPITAAKQPTALNAVNDTYYAKQYIKYRSYVLEKFHLGHHASSTTSSLMIPMVPAALLVDLENIFSKRKKESWSHVMFSIQIDAWLDSVEDAMGRSRSPQHNPMQ